MFKVWSMDKTRGLGVRANVLELHAGQFTGGTMTVVAATSCARSIAAARLIACGRGNMRFGTNGGGATLGNDILIGFGCRVYVVRVGRGQGGVNFVGVLLRGNWLLI